MSTISSVSSTPAPVSTDATNKPNKQARADFKSLADALKNGDLQTAQTAFAQLQKDDPNVAKKLASQSDSSNSSDPLNDLATALNNNDLSAAQTAMGSIKKGHHGGHHHSKPVSNDQTDPATTTATTANTDPDATTGTVIDVKV